MKGLAIIATLGRRVGDRSMRLESQEDAARLRIDGATGKSETAESVLERSVRCATCFRTLGLGCGDVVAIIAPNHLDVCVPFYATQYLGMIVAPLDRNLEDRELEDAFNEIKPKLVFCQNYKCRDVYEALRNTNLKAKVVSFDKSDICMSLKEFHEKYEIFETIEDFKPTDFDTQDTISLLIGTSGSTGRAKFVALTHMNMACGLPFCMSTFDNFPTPTRLIAVFSPFQWISAIAIFVLSPILRVARLQTSFNTTFSIEHVTEMIDIYQPTVSLLSATFLNILLKSGKNINLLSYEVICVGGSVVSQEMISAIQAISPGTQMRCMYGMTECGFTMLNDDINRATSLKPLGNSKCRTINRAGQRLTGLLVSRYLTQDTFQLVDPNTGEDIEEPNVQGELWMSGPSVFRGYYNQPEESKGAFSEDGWLKSGDIFYRDENYNYYFVERAKLYFKYFSKEHGNNFKISPVEIEDIIRKNPGVLDVAVTGMPQSECGEVPVAFVVRRNGCDVTSQEIEYIVKENLADQKQLRGGVVFVSELPLTPNTKIDRRKLREMATNLESK